MKNPIIPKEYVALYVLWLVFPVAILALGGAGYLVLAIREYEYRGDYQLDNYYHGCGFVIRWAVFHFVLLSLCVLSLTFSFRSMRRHHARVLSGYTPPEYATGRLALYDASSAPLDASSPHDTSYWVRRGYSKHWWFLGAWSLGLPILCIINFGLGFAAEPACA